MECKVKGCLNHKHQGNFVGEFCSPCYKMLITGKIERGTSFIHKLQQIEGESNGITEQHIMKETNIEKLRKLALLLIGGLRIWKKRCEDVEGNIKTTLISDPTKEIVKAALRGSDGGSLVAKDEQEKGG